jgi:hypothetical protein
VNDKEPIDFGPKQGIPVCPLHDKRDAEFSQIKGDTHAAAQRSLAALVVSSMGLAVVLALLFLHFFPNAPMGISLIP